MLSLCTYHCYAPLPPVRAQIGVWWGISTQNTPQGWGIGIPIDATKMSSKKVLAMFKGHSRPVSFTSGGLEELKGAVASAFQEYSLEGKRFFLKLESQEWGGKFIDIGPEDDIPDKAVIEIHVRWPNY